MHSLGTTGQQHAECWLGAGRAAAVLTAEQRRALPESCCSPRLPASEQHQRKARPPAAAPTNSNAHRQHQAAGQCCGAGEQQTMLLARCAAHNTNSSYSGTALLTNQQHPDAPRQQPGLPLGCNLHSEHNRLPLLASRCLRRRRCNACLASCRGRWQRRQRHCIACRLRMSHGCRPRQYQLRRGAAVGRGMGGGGSGGSCCSVAWRPVCCWHPLLVTHRAV